MNDTKSYILQMRDTLTQRLAVRFIAWLILFALSCACAFVCVPRAASGGYFLAVSPVDRSSIPAAALTVIRSMLPSAVCLFAVYAAAHTLFAPAVSGAVILWRGLCLGCAGALMGNGTVSSIGRYWPLALTLYFAASVLIILLAAYSHVYSLCLCRAHADGMSGIRREIALEYLRLFLLLSGGVFAAGCTAVFLL